MRLIFLHGFTQTHHHWHESASLIAERAGHATLAFVDLPGHGLSSDDDTPIDTAGDALVALAGPGTYIGYSMGARFALHAALARPDAVERLVLVGGTPGLRTEAERVERRAADELRAQRVLDVGVERFVSEWLAAPLFATLTPERAGTSHRHGNTASGLASSLRRSGTGAQSSLWDRLGELSMPVLVLAGDLDAKFAAIGRDMASLIGDASYATVAGAGHAVVAERPDRVAQLIGDWLPTR